MPVMPGEPAGRRPIPRGHGRDKMTATVHKCHCTLCLLLICNCVACAENAEALGPASSHLGSSDASGGDTEDVRSRSLDPLVTLFHCPDWPLQPSCNQSSLRAWASSCCQRAEAPDLWQADLLVALAHLGASCNRTSSACHWPTSCHLQDWTPEGGPSSTAAAYQHQILDHLGTLARNDCQTHFDARTLMDEVPLGDAWTTGGGSGGISLLRVLATATVRHLLQGNCIGALEVQEEQLQEDKDPAGNAYLDAVFQKYSYGLPGVDEQGLQHLLEDVGLAVDDGTTGNSSSDDDGGHPLASGSGHLERSAVQGDAEALPDDINRCLTNRELLRAFDADGEGDLDEDELLQASAYIVHHISMGNQSCQQDDDDDGGHDSTSAQAYGYGTLCVFVISACSALGFVIIPMLSESVYETMMAAFIALAFGTLTGDALLHMLPESLLPPEDDSVKVPDSFWKCLVIMLSIYGLFVFETLTGILSGGHGHSHGSDVEAAMANVAEHGHSHVLSHDLILDRLKPGKGVVDGQQQEDATGTDEMSTKHPSSDGATPTAEVSKPEVDGDQEKDLLNEMITVEHVPVFLGLTSLALVIIVGDAIHNVTDGIAIGAAFADSVSEGFSTALAVFFHELPHEFGDFVILLMTGLSLRRALYWNFVASLSSFIGLYVGIVIGENDAATQWIFAVTTGMFLYVAIADMLPELRNMKMKRPWLGFVAQNIGTLFGMGFMVFMYFLEDMIHF